MEEVGNYKYCMILLVFLKSKCIGIEKLVGVVGGMGGK